MPSSIPKRSFWRGARDGAPFTLIVGPFAAVFGVVASEAGLTLAQTFGFSALVIAGAAQIAAVQLMVEAAPMVVVLATALAVNLRMAMYSAALAPHLGGAPLWQRALIAYLNVDQSFAVSSAKYEAMPEMSVPEKIGYFLGVMAPVAPVWYGMTVVGAVLGQQIPDWLALDFAVPIAFLAVIAPALKTVAHVAAAFTSVVLALALSGLPFGTGLLVAGFVAMCVGAAVETAMERRV
ncbi:MAG: AzlC family ABC transporter permease [Pseudomonadota bacterium]